MEHTYVERGFRASGIKDGQFNTLPELEQHTNGINGVMRRSYMEFEQDAYNGLADLNTHEIYGVVHPSHTKHEQLLADNVMSLQRSIDTHSTQLCELMTTYARADVQAQLYLQDRPDILNDPHKNVLYRAAFRINAFPGEAQFIFDLDNTVTVENPEYPYYEKLVPATEFADPYMAKHARGREVFTSVHPRGWAQVQDRLPETFRSVGSQVELRAYMDELMGDLKDHNHKVSVLTAGMDPLAQGILGQLKNRSAISEVRSVKSDNVNSNYKALSLKDMALRSPNSPVEFVGDGSSDQPAAQSDVPLALCYALAGGGFEKALQQSGQLYRPYTNGRDIQRDQAEIRRIIDTELAGMVKSAA